MSAKPPRGASTWRRYLRFWGPNVDADVDDELAFHLDMRGRDYEARGLTPDEARRAAAERFGDVQGIGGALRVHDRLRQRGRERREYMSDLTNDLRYGLRSFSRAPAFTTVALLTLALGIGATTAIFSVVNAVILRPLPYPESDRIVQVWMDNRRTGLKEDLHSFPNFADLRDQNRVFSDMAAYFTSGYNLTTGCREGECEPQRVATLFSSADLFKVLAITPAMGRRLHGRGGRAGTRWRRRDQPRPVDAALRVATATSSGAPCVSTAASAPSSAFCRRASRFRTATPTVWVPMALDADDRQRRSSFGFYAVARLKPGVQFDRAVTDLGAIARRLEQQYPTNADLGVHLVPLPEQVVGRTLRTSLWVMMAAVGAVLLIACANVANLMLSRAAVREREISVRVALGAARTRLVRQLLTESVLLSTLGAALGVGLAWGGLRVLTRIAPNDIPRLDQVRIDPLALAVTLGLAIVTGLAFGLAPALQSSRAAVGSALRESIRGGTGRPPRATHAAHRSSALQIALVVMLLTGAGCSFAASCTCSESTSGFRPDHLLTMRFSMPRAKYHNAAGHRGLPDGAARANAAGPGRAGRRAASPTFSSPRRRTPRASRSRARDDARGAEHRDPARRRVAGLLQGDGHSAPRGRAFTAADNLDAPQVVDHQREHGAALLA